MPRTNIPKPRFIGLFEIENNLVQYNSTRTQKLLNLELCVIYKLLGVNKGFLFTDYGLAALTRYSDEMERRIEPLSIPSILIRKLATHGIYINNVITIYDIIYEAITTHNDSDIAAVIATAANPAIDVDEVRLFFHGFTEFTNTESGVEYPSFTLGAYYAHILQSQELDFLATKSHYEMAENPTYSIDPQIQLRSIWLNHTNYQLNFKIETAAKLYAENEPEISRGYNLKYQLFYHLVKYYGAGQIARGVQEIKSQNIVFVFSDANQEACELIRRAAVELDLSRHLLIFFSNNGKRESMAYYFKQFPKPLCVIKKLIWHQEKLSKTITTENLYTQAWNFNYKAFEQLAIAAIERFKGIGCFKRLTKTFQDELDNTASCLLQLKFLKLAWLTREDPYGELAEIRPTLQDEIFHDNLYAIYCAQQRLSQNRTKINNESSLISVFQNKNSKWLPFLKLANDIDQLVVNSVDITALFRLALYYAVIDAATTNFLPSGNHDIIEHCFERIITLLTLNKPVQHQQAIANIRSLAHEILSREYRVIPSCFSRWFARRRVTLHATYAFYLDSRSTLVTSLLAGMAPDNYGTFDNIALAPLFLEDEHLFDSPPSSPTRNQ